jgi:hypothetical protein
MILNYQRLWSNTLSSTRVNLAVKYTLLLLPVIGLANKKIGKVENIQKNKELTYICSPF